MASFQDWFRGLIERKLATVNERIISLDKAVAGRFLMGLAGGRFFTSMQPREADWAIDMPWSHAAHHKGHPQLYLVCDELAIGDGRTFRFAIELEVANAAQLNVLRTLDEVDLRRSEGERLSAGPFRTVPLYLLETGEPVLEDLIEARPRHAAAA